MRRMYRYQINIFSIYRTKDIEVIKELMKFALHEDDTILEVWKNKQQQH